MSIMAYQVCPHQFITPSISFLNAGQNISIINAIRALNIPILEEISVFNEKGLVDNIIIQDPGGFGFFVFND